MDVIAKCSSQTFLSHCNCVWGCLYIPRSPVTLVLFSLTFFRAPRLNSIFCSFHRAQIYIVLWHLRFLAVMLMITQIFWISCSYCLILWYHEHFLNHLAKVVSIRCPWLFGSCFCLCYKGNTPLIPRLPFRLLFVKNLARCECYFGASVPRSILLSSLPLSIFLSLRRFFKYIILVERNTALILNLNFLSRWPNFLQNMFQVIALPCISRDGQGGVLEFVVQPVTHAHLKPDIALCSRISVAWSA